jgi:hypothetical protein
MKKLVWTQWMKLTGKSTNAYEVLFFCYARLSGSLEWPVLKSCGVINLVFLTSYQFYSLKDTNFLATSIILKLFKVGIGTKVQ